LTCLYSSCIDIPISPRFTEYMKASMFSGERQVKRPNVDTEHTVPGAFIVIGTRLEPRKPLMGPSWDFRQTNSRSLVNKISVYKCYCEQRFSRSPPGRRGTLTVRRYLGVQTCPMCPEKGDPTSQSTYGCCYSDAGEPSTEKDINEGHKKHDQEHL
jgi:hypothetical protein